MRLWSLSLSPSVFTKETWAIRKKRWTHEGPSIQKKRKKVGHMKVHEKKRDEKKKEIAMLSKRIYKWRETIQKEFPSTIYHPPYSYTCTS